MKSFSVGVVVGGFGDRLQEAAKVGADGVQVYTVNGESSPEEMDATKRKDAKQLCADLGLTISATCGEMGAYRDADENVAKVAKCKKILELAVDLGTKVVTGHIGVVPEDQNDEMYKVMVASLREIAEHAASLGISYGIETGPEKAVTLKSFLDDVDSKGLGVNLDPANLVMVVADDPVKAVHTLKDYIVHTHAKDGVQLRSTNAEEAYHGKTPVEEGPSFKEMPLGEGGVDWVNYLNALEEVGYDGFLTIERECGDDWSCDIGRAVTFLKDTMKG